MELTKQDFSNLVKFIYEKCGIVIKDEKVYLVQQRLEPIAKLNGCHTFSEFYLKLITNCTPNLSDALITAITTNETSFFRDKHPFDTFENHILPELGRAVEERKGRTTERKGSKARIWCAASSTGQEPYCLAMIISEYIQKVKHKGIEPGDFSIVATDISSKVLAQAISGEFSDYEVKRGLKESYMNKYFFKEDGDRGKWVIDQNIRDLVEFRRLNLMEPFTKLGGFDAIFCRNVLIYFDEDSKRRIFDQFHHMLSNDGFLVLGSTESTYGITDKFKSARENSTIIYKKV